MTAAAMKPRRGVSDPLGTLPRVSRLPQDRQQGRFLVGASELDPLIDALRTFTEERAWSKFHDPKNLAMLLASEAGELLALLRWVAGSEADEFVRDPLQRGKVEAEIADVAIALLLFCDRAGIDLPRAVHAKLEVNRRNYPVALSRGHSARPERPGD